MYSFYNVQYEYTQLELIRINSDNFVYFIPICINVHFLPCFDSVCLFVCCSCFLFVLFCLFACVCFVFVCVFVCLSL